MNLKVATLVLFALLFSVLTYANPLDSIGVTKIEGKLHVKYLVSPGETIYGISTKFGVSVADLMEINPELENGLKVGQVINIPYNPQAMAKKDNNKIVHKVQPGETFYSLSRKYNVSVDELMKMNEIQLKAGQEIVVGYKDQPSKTATTATNTNTVTTTTTTSSVSNVATTGKTSTVTKPVEENKTVTSAKTVTTDNETKTTPVAEKAVTKTEVSTNTNSTQVAIENKPVAAEKTIVNTAVAEESTEQYPFDPSRQQVMVIPFDPYLYFSDADDEIAARSNMPRTKVRQVFRRRLNAMLNPNNYETIHLLGGKAKDSLSDLNKIYSMVTYNYQKVVPSPYYKEPVAAKPLEKEKTNKNWIERQKTKINHLTSGETVSSSYETPQDLGSYFGVIIKNPDFFTYFNNKYSIDYYIFVSQFEVKTNYEHCLDRAAQNYDRTFTTHYSIFDKNGKQISGNKFKTHYNSNSNYVYQIVADNMEQIANRIMAELPPAGQ